MKYEYWLARIRGISAKKKRMLREHMNSAESVYYIEETQLKKIEFLNESEQDKILKAKRQDPEKEYESLCEKGIRFIPHFTDEYPEKLKRISDYPYALYVKAAFRIKLRKRRLSWERGDVLLMVKNMQLILEKFWQNMGCRL